jgi:hypothetical protein
MSPLLLPFQFVLLSFSGWVNRHQLDVIEYLQEENRVLKGRLGGRRLRFTDVERCRLARKAQAPGRKVLNELETGVTPDTPFALVPGTDRDQVGLPPSARSGQAARHGDHCGSRCAYGA